MTGLLRVLLYFRVDVWDLMQNLLSYAFYTLVSALFLILFVLLVVLAWNGIFAESFSFMDSR